MAAERIVVVGAGPAGVRAARTIARAGRSVVVLDEGTRAGGQIYRQPPPGAERDPHAIYGFETAKARAVHTALDGFGDLVDYRPGTLVWNLFDRTLDLLGPDGHRELDFDRLLVATGAMDRVIPFPGWALPGVFTLGAAQIALKAQGLSIGRKVVFVGAGPLLPLVAHQYRKAGANVAAVLDATRFASKAAALPGLLAQPATLAKGLLYAGLASVRGGAAYGLRRLRALGSERVEGLEWEDARGRIRTIECDAVGASFGLRSETQLADLAGCRFVFDAVTRQWLPERTPQGRSSIAGIYLAGDGANIGGADVAELQGERAALAMLEDLGEAPDERRAAVLDAALARQARFRAALERAYPFPDHLLDALPDDEVLCRCEGVRVRAVREAASERDAAEMNRLKAFTRIGMGRCQGRVCGAAAAELLAQANDMPIEAVGRLRGQPPVKPIPVMEITG